MVLRQKTGKREWAGVGGSWRARLRRARGQGQKRKLTRISCLATPALGNFCRDSKDDLPTSGLPPAPPLSCWRRIGNPALRYTRVCQTGRSCKHALCGTKLPPAYASSSYVERLAVVPSLAMSGASSYSACWGKIQRLLCPLGLGVCSSRFPRFSWRSPLAHCSPRLSS